MEPKLTDIIVKNSETSGILKFQSGEKITIILSIKDISPGKYIVKYTINPSNSCFPKNSSTKILKLPIEEEEKLLKIEQSISIELKEGKSFSLIRPKVEVFKLFYEDGKPVLEDPIASDVQRTNSIAIVRQKK